MSKRVLLFAILFGLALAPALCAQSSTDVWNNPQAESEYLAVEITGQLRPTGSLANQIKNDLAAIRLARPDLANIRVFPSWMPGETLVGLTPAAFSAFQSGTFHGFDSLYADLGVPSASTSSFGQYAHLRFGQIYHGQRLAELFRPITGVRYADPNGVIGDGNDIVARANRTYTLSRGYGDCPAGCIQHQYWDFTVTNQGVFPGLLPTSGSHGDFNGDGTVDSADYVLMRRNMVSSNDATSYNMWRGSFGTTTGGSGGATSQSSIPEPSLAALCVFCCTLALLRRTRRPL
jgi:hypothetical protein